MMLNFQVFRGTYTTILFSLLVSCSLLDKNTEKNAADHVFLNDSLRCECYDLNSVVDSHSLFHCRLYDTSTNHLRISGNFIFYPVTGYQAYGWIKYWGEDGKLTDKVEHTIFKNPFRTEINQYIVFGLDSLDTIADKSHYLTHTLEYLNTDSVLIRMHYNGWRAYSSKYSYSVYTEIKNEFVFRTGEPRISLKLPIARFVKDSVIQLIMIKTGDSDTGEDMIYMHPIYYDIPLQKD